MEKTEPFITTIVNVLKETILKRKISDKVQERKDYVVDARN